MKTTFVFLSIVVCGVFLPACSEKPSQSTPPSAPAAPASAAATGASAPPVSVITIKAQRRDMAVQLNTTGTVTPLTSVDVRTQVTSTIRQVHFKEGEFVKAGQLLFTLDARTDEANAAKARAQQAKDAASLSDTQRQLARAKQLLAQNFVSQGAVDTAQAQVDAAAATVNADKAAVDASLVALSYDRIVAPNSGRAGQVGVFAGSAVQANLTPLVTITQLDPIGVNFSIPQRNLTDALEALKAGGAAVTATLADGGGSFKGRLKFVDNVVDANSGAVKVKAVFDNHDKRLWPGLFVDVQQTVNTLKDAVVIPQAAIIQSQRGPTVYVVSEGKATLRTIKLVYAEGNDAAVAGVKPGESVVQDGKENVRPNASIMERARDPSRAASAAGQPAKS
jgi:RND family efflux transporter MFP subunit